MAKSSMNSCKSGAASGKAGINQDIYGADDTCYAENISSRILGVPDPTLDVWGEKDPRAVSEGNHGTQGGGRSDQGRPKEGDETSRPSSDGGHGRSSPIDRADSQ